MNATFILHPNHKLRRVFKLVILALFLGTVSSTFAQSKPQASASTSKTKVPARYATFLSCFSDSCAYAIDSISGHEVLFVTSYTYHGDEKNPDALNTIGATMFTLDKTGKIVSLGSVQSQGTLYPLTISNQTLIRGGHHSLYRYAIKVSDDMPSLDVTETYDEEFNTNGHATYTYTNYSTDTYSKKVKEKDFSNQFKDFENGHTIAFKPLK